MTQTRDCQFRFTTLVPISLKIQFRLHTRSSKTDAAFSISHELPFFGTSVLAGLAISGFQEEIKRTIYGGEFHDVTLRIS